MTTNPNIYDETNNWLTLAQVKRWHDLEPALWPYDANEPIRLLWHGRASPERFQVRCGDDSIVASHPQAGNAAEALESVIDNLLAGDGGAISWRRVPTRAERYALTCRLVGDLLEDTCRNFSDLFVQFIGHQSKPWLYPANKPSDAVNLLHDLGRAILAIAQDHSDALGNLPLNLFGSSPRAPFDAFLASFREIWLLWYSFRESISVRPSLQIGDFSGYAVYRSETRQLAVHLPPAIFDQELLCSTVGRESETPRGQVRRWYRELSARGDGRSVFVALALEVARAFVTALVDISEFDGIGSRRQATIWEDGANVLNAFMSVLLELKSQEPSGSTSQPDADSEFYMIQRLCCRFATAALNAIATVERDNSGGFGKGLVYGISRETLARLATGYVPWIDFLTSGEADILDHGVLGFANRELELRDAIFRTDGYAEPNTWVLSNMMTRSRSSSQLERYFELDYIPKMAARLASLRTWYIRRYDFVRAGLVALHDPGRPAPRLLAYTPFVHLWRLWYPYTLFLLSVIPFIALTVTRGKANPIASSYIGVCTAYASLGVLSILVIASGISPILQSIVRAIVAMLLPRMFAGVVTGYLLVIISDTVLRAGMKIEPLRLSLVTSAFIVACYLYLFITVQSRVEDWSVAARRSIRILVTALLHSVVLGYILLDMLGSVAIPAEVRTEESYPWPRDIVLFSDGRYTHLLGVHHMYPSLLPFLGSFALFVGVFVQLMWQERDFAGFARS